MASGEFRALWAAQVLSVAGDQLARIALTLLVYDRTRSDHGPAAHGCLLSGSLIPCLGTHMLPTSPAIPYLT
jgi:hypothetical protein